MLIVPILLGAMSFSPAIKVVATARRVFFKNQKGKIMANKIKLGARPKTFKPMTVTFPMPDGAEGCIEATFKYRTRTEFGQMIDEIFKDAKDQKPSDGDFSMADLMEKTRDKNADYLNKIMFAWNLDEELNSDALRQLADEIPAAGAALMEAYRNAALEGKLGN